MATVLRQCEGKQLICVCCVCGEARDDIAADGAWYSLKAHLRKYGIEGRDLAFSHTFCPGCFMHYKEQLGLVPSRAAQMFVARMSGRDVFRREAN